MNERLLPIGSVVLLKKAKKNIMITSYFIFSVKDKEKKIFDYGGCPFPLGILNADSALGFNHEDIEKVVFTGYQDDEEKELVKNLLEKETEMKDTIREQLSKIEKKEA